MPRSAAGPKRLTGGAVLNGRLPPQTDCPIMTQPQQPRKELTPGHRDRTEGQDPEALAWTKQLSQADPDPAAAGALTVDMTSSGKRHGALLSKPRPEAPGYKIGRLLGTGTYGEVWQAQEEGTDIRVAIKFFAHGTGQQWQMLQ